jgi:hypothetical protein
MANQCGTAHYRNEVGRVLTPALLEMILVKLNERKNRLLLTAQVGLPENQFDAYRTILLDELGRNGFEKDLEKVLLQHTEWNGTGRNTHAGKEVPK